MNEETRRSGIFVSKRSLEDSYWHKMTISSSDSSNRNDRCLMSVYIDQNIMYMTIEKIGKKETDKSNGTEEDETLGPGTQELPRDLY